jgi:hypothetical protein
MGLLSCFAISIFHAFSPNTIRYCYSILPKQKLSLMMHNAFACYFLLRSSIASLGPFNVCLQVLDFDRD